MSIMTLDIIIPEKTAFKPFSKEHQKTLIYAARLLQKLPESKVYHTKGHTFHPRLGVIAVADAHAKSLGLSKEERLKLSTMAAFHDTGHILLADTSTGHEEISSDYASHYLRANGYSENFIDEITRGIMKTKVNFAPDAPLTSPTTILEQILCDADLDNLGRLDKNLMHNSSLKPYGFIAQTDLVRREEGESDLKKWFGNTKYLMTKHNSFYSEPAQLLRNVGEQTNLNLVESYLNDEPRAIEYVNSILKSRT